MANEAQKESLISGSLNKLSELLRARLPDDKRFVILCAIVGVSSGLVAVFFHEAIDLISHLLIKLPGDSTSPWYWVTLPLIPAGGGLVVGIVLAKWAPGARGSGIPQTKAAFYNKFGLIRLREGVMRFILGAISIGTGTSLGREGPTVHICSTIASKIGRWFGLARPRVQAMVPVGMASGIAAAFNTPLAAITFVFEELLDDFSSKALGGILVAVVIASVVSRALLGENPAFQIETYAFHSYSWIVVSIVLGLAAAFIGHGFVGTLLWLRNKFQHSKIPIWIQPAMGGLSVGLIATLILFLSDGAHVGVMGIGYEELSLALKGSLALKIVCMLFVGKIIATLVSYSMGGSGGLFAPVLFIGAMLGAIIGSVFEGVFNITDTTAGMVALLGMGAFFAAVIRCPLTSLLIIFEMTLNYSLILPLMVGNMLAFYISAKLRPIPLYNALLLQDKVTLKKMPSYMGAQDWKNLPVTTIMTHDPVSAYDNLTLNENLLYLRKNKHHAYPVRKENRTLVNIITHHELIDWEKEHGEKILSELLEEHPLVTMTPNTSIRKAAQILVNADKEQAPVISRKHPNRLVGFVTLHDIARQQNALEGQLGR